jgi:hypothetical protein
VAAKKAASSKPCRFSPAHAQQPHDMPSIELPRHGAAAVAAAASAMQ